MDTNQLLCEHTSVMRDFIKSLQALTQLLNAVKDGIAKLNEKQ
jgi:hypothetical protein